MSNQKWGKRKRDGQSYVKGSVPVTFRTSGGYVYDPNVPTRRNIFDPVPINKNAEVGWATKESDPDYIAWRYQHYVDPLDCPDEIIVSDYEYNRLVTTLKPFSTKVLHELEKIGVDIERDQTGKVHVKEEFIVLCSIPSASGQRAIVIDPQGYDYPRYKAGLWLGQDRYLI